MPDVSVIIPAAGSSRRMQGLGQKKQFAQLHQRPVWLRTVEHFSSRDDVAQIALVLASEDMDDFRDRFRPNLAFLDLTIVEGGATRAESVQNGLKALTADSDLIAIHDAARPLLTTTWVSQIFDAARKSGAVIPGVAISSTVKRVDDAGIILKTVDRSNLFLAQTPQVFRRDILTNAFEVAENAAKFTDEAALVSASGVAVVIHPGWPMNIKLTTAEDFELAKTYLEALPAGGGLKDLAPFADERFRQS